LFKVLSDVFQSAPISYVKWDMNRNMSEVWSDSLSSDQQGEVAHRYILGLYELLNKLTGAFPTILFESSASGGNRFDPGMLFYMPQSWASDNTDPMERLKIQYGTSVVYPLSTIGAHVSHSPNNQTKRETSIETRFHVAMFGVLGYELDPKKLTQQERDRVKEQVYFYKTNRSLLQSGTFYRLMSPFEHNDTAWMVVSYNKEEAIVGFYRTLAKPNPGLTRVLLYGLNPEKKYCLTRTGEVFFGDELMNVGYLLPPFYSGTGYSSKSFLAGDFQSYLLKFESYN
jgi:alpha-galactosidase